MTRAIIEIVSGNSADVIETLNKAEELLEKLELQPGMSMRSGTSGYRLHDFLKDVQELLAYNWASEDRDYQQQLADMGSDSVDDITDPDFHIFNRMRRMQWFIDAEKTDEEV